MNEEFKLRHPGKYLAVFLLAAFFLQGCYSDQAQRAYEKAEVALAEGRYKEALAAYNGVVAGYGSSGYGAKSQLRVGFIYDRYLREEDKALEAYSELIYLYPGSVEASDARGEMAGIYSRRGEFTRAIEEYQKLLEKRPQNAGKVKLAIAMEYVKMNDLKQARVELNELLKIAPPELVPQVKYHIADTYYLEGDNVEALKRLDGIISEYPADPISGEALFEKARVLDEEGDLDEALKILKGLEGKYPNKEALRTAVELMEKRLNAGPGRKAARMPGLNNKEN